MVTARQIQQLTRQRLEGTVPSYPEQWLEGPMVRRERRIMNRGGILYGRRAKTLPRLKPGGSAKAPVAAKKKPTDADARLADFAARPRSAEEKRARTERALAVIAAGCGADEEVLLRPAETETSFEHFLWLIRGYANPERASFYLQKHALRKWEAHGLRADASPPRARPYEGPRRKR